MKVSIQLPSDFEIEEVEYDPKSRTITFSPVFAGSRATAAIGYITIANGKGTKVRQSLKVSGGSGKCVLSSPVRRTPAFDGG